MSRAGHVMVVEDDESIRATLVDVLEDEGYVVSAAENGRQALELLARGGTLDLILLDLFMPEMSGMDLLRERARLSPLAAGVPVVVISAAPPGSTDVASIVPLTSGFIRKPMDLDELLAVVSRFCG